MPMLTKQQETALCHPCYFGFETAQPRYRRQYTSYSVIISINAGYE